MRKLSGMLWLCSIQNTDSGKRRRNILRDYEERGLGIYYIYLIEKNHLRQTVFESSVTTSQDAGADHQLPKLDQSNTSDKQSLIHPIEQAKTLELLNTIRR